MADKTQIYRANRSPHLASALAAVSLFCVGFLSSSFHDALAQTAAIPNPPPLPSVNGDAALDVPPPPAPPAPKVEAAIDASASRAVADNPADPLLPPPPPKPAAPALEEPAKTVEVVKDNPLDIPELPDAPNKNNDGTRKVDVDPSQFLQGQELSPQEREAEIQKLLNEFSDSKNKDVNKRRTEFEIDFNKLAKPTAEIDSGEATQEDSKNPSKDKAKAGNKKSRKEAIEKLASDKAKQSLGKQSGDSKTDATKTNEPKRDPRLMPERSRYHNYKTYLIPQEYITNDLGRENDYIPRAEFNTDYYEFLYAASYRGNLNGVRALLDKGVAPNQVSKNGFTPLMAAAQTGQLDTVRLLLLRGAEPNFATGDGVTALHVAAANSSINTVKALLHMGANPRAVNNAGQTAGDVARSRGRQDVAMLLDGGIATAPAIVRNPANVGITVQPLAPQAVPQIYNAPVAEPIYAPYVPSVSVEMPAPYVDADLPFPPVPLHKPANPLAYSYTAPVTIPTVITPTVVTPVAPVKSTMLPQAAYRVVPSMLPYNALSAAEQKLWKERLKDWKEANTYFSKLSFEQKIEYNYRRKVLIQIFPKESLRQKHWLAFDKDLSAKLIAESGYVAPAVAPITTVPVMPAPLQKLPEIKLPPLEKLAPIVTPAPAPKTSAYQNLSGANYKTSLSGDDRLTEVLANWHIIDSRFSTMNNAQRLRGNEQRRRLLDLLVADSSTGSYATAFAKMPMAEIEAFIATQAKWEKFEESERKKRPDYAILMRPWGGEDADPILKKPATKPESRTRARLPKSVRDLQ